MAPPPIDEWKCTQRRLGSVSVVYVGMPALTLCFCWLRRQKCQKRQKMCRQSIIINFTAKSIWFLSRKKGAEEMLC